MPTSIQATWNSCATLRVFFETIYRDTCWYCETDTSLPPTEFTTLELKKNHPATPKTNLFERIYMGVSKNKVPQNGWFIRANPIKMDDLGVSLFLETPILWGPWLFHPPFYPGDYQRVSYPPCCDDCWPFGGTPLRFATPRSSSRSYWGLRGQWWWEPTTVKPWETPCWNSLLNDKLEKYQDFILKYVETCWNVMKYIIFIQIQNSSNIQDCPLYIQCQLPAL